MTPLLLAVVGLIGIVCGVLASRANDRAARDDSAMASWKRRTSFAGIVLGVASWPLTGLMTYPFVEDRGGVGKVAGIPFLVAYFNEVGHDFVGPLTPPALVLNAVFWFLVPHSVLYLAATRRRRGAAGDGGRVPTP